MQNPFFKNDAVFTVSNEIDESLHFLLDLFQKNYGQDCKKNKKSFPIS